MGNTRRIGYSRQVIRNTITVKGYSSCRCKWFDGAYWTSITGPVLLVPEHCRAGASVKQLHASRSIIQRQVRGKHIGEFA